MHADKMLSNLHKDHQMCYKMQRGAKGRSHTHCPLQQSSLPPFTSPSLFQRHVHTLCQQTVSALGNWCTDCCCFSLPLFTPPNNSPSFPVLPLFIPSVLSSTFSLLCHSARHFSSAGYKGRTCWRESACVISGCTWAPRVVASAGKATNQRTYKQLQDKLRVNLCNKEEEGILLRK